jgi:energy-coupling factor transporter ATP-binding protein EcfA2
MSILQDLNSKDASVVLVTHEQDIAAYCSRIVAFRDGMIVSDRPNPRVAATSHDLNYLSSDPELGGPRAGTGPWGLELADGDKPGDGCDHTERHAELGCGVRTDLALPVRYL